MQEPASPSASPAEPADRLQELGAALPRRGTVLILPHDYPDPDALASAGAVALLLERRFHLSPRILFSGMVARAENRVLLRHFRYRWRPTADYRPPRRGTIPTIFVDGRPWSENITVPACARPVAVFDHHPLHGRRIPAGLLVDIRPRLGATATMLFEYLTAAGVAIPTWLASAMAYAISTETLDFTRAFLPEDQKAYTRLIARANLRILGEIRNAPLSQAYFMRMREAIDHARLYGRTAWSRLEAVDQPEIVAEIADRLLQIERITWSFCSAFHGDRLILSLRSNRRSAECGELLRRLMPRNGEAGGHDRMAAGAVDLAGQDAAQRAAMRETLERRLLHRIEQRTAGSDESPAKLSRPLAPRAD